MLRTIINERFAFAVSDPLLADGGATLLDLESGAFFSMNATAADIWRRFLEGESKGAIAKDIAAKAGMSEREAMSVADDVLSPVETGIAAEGVADESGWPAVQPTPYDITSDGENGFVFSHLEQKLFRFDPESRMIKRIAQLSEAEWRQHLWSFSPNLLAMMGVPTLHAAGVMDGEQVVLFSGPSGAGKTTTSKYWAEATGSQVVCEDKAVLTEKDGRLMLILDAEAGLKSWVTRGAAYLSHEGTLSVRELEHTLMRSRTAPIGEVNFLDASQRREGLRSIETAPIGKGDETSFLLRQSFSGTGSRSDWEGRFRWVSLLASNSIIRRMVVPNGVLKLERAIRRAAHPVVRSN